MIKMANATSYHAFDRLIISGRAVRVRGGISAPSAAISRDCDLWIDETNHVIKVFNGTNYTSGDQAFDDIASTGTLTMTGTKTYAINITGVYTTAAITAVSPINTTLTAPAAPANAVYGFIDANGTAGWTGSLAAIRGRNTIADTGQIGNAYGGWFGLKFTATQGTGAGLTGAIYGEVLSDKVGGGQPTGVLLLQAVPITSVDMSGVPMITFACSGAGTKPKYAFAWGWDAGTYCSTAADNATVMFRTGGGATNGTVCLQGLQVRINGGDYLIPAIALADWKDS